MSDLLRLYLWRTLWTAVPTLLLLMIGMGVAFLKQPQGAVAPYAAWLNILMIVMVLAIGLACLAADARNKYWSEWAPWAAALAAPWYAVTAIYSVVSSNPVLLAPGLIVFVGMGLIVWAQELLRRRRFTKLGLKAGPSMRKRNA